MSDDNCIRSAAARWLSRYGKWFDERNRERKPETNSGVGNNVCEARRTASEDRVVLSEPRSATGS